MRAIKAALVTALVVLVFVALAALSQSKESKDYLDCAKRGWSPEVCAAKLGYETGKGE